MSCTWGTLLARKERFWIHKSHRSNQVGLSLRVRQTDETLGQTIHNQSDFSFSQ